MIVVDASAVVSALLNDGPARRLLATDQVHVPHLIDTDVHAPSGSKELSVGLRVDAMAEAPAH